MPSRKKQDYMKLTFSKKNKDIYDFLEEKKKDDSFVATDYICEAVRFYNKNKDSLNDMNIDTINKIIEMKLAALNIQQQNSDEEAIGAEENFHDRYMLESDIDNIDIDED